MNNGYRDGLGVTFARGALAGLTGTMVLDAVMSAQQKVRPDDSPSLKGNPTQFIIDKLEKGLPEGLHRNPPSALEEAIEGALPVGYGATFGSLYAALRPRGGNPLIDGPILGLASWAAGLVGWLPGADLTPPVIEHRPEEVATSILEHAIYGIAVVGAYNWLRER